jgi:WS/DGAT/MGAT family acyltransferase
MSELIPIGSFDRFLLRSETRETPAHTASLNMYRIPPGAPATYLHDLFAHLSSFPAIAPPFNYVLSGSRRSGRPAWRIVQDIDLEYHLRHSAVPHPGGEREIGTLISRLHANALDFSRPLWEFHLIEGLENNRFATYLKMHHALADGVAVVDIITGAMAETPHGSKLPPPWANVRPATTAEDFGAVRKTKSSARPSAKRNSGLMRALAKTAGAQFVRRATGFVAPYAAPRCILNGKVTPARRYATQSYKIARLKVLALASGGTVNDVVLGICGSALRRYLLQLDELPKRPVIALVPVALEREADEKMGSVVAAITVSLATHLADVKARFAATVESAKAAKAHLLNLPRWKMEIYKAIVMLPFALGRLSSRKKPRGLMGNLGISNVPGPKKRLYFHGAEVEALYPCSIIMQGYPLNITARSYCDSINLGFLACRDLLPHFQRLAVYTGEALAELEQVYGIESRADPNPIPAREILTPGEVHGSHV